MLEMVRTLLKDHGELMIHMDSGETFELHLGNTAFEGDTIMVDDRIDKYYLDGTKIETVQLHYHATTD